MKAFSFGGPSFLRSSLFLLFLTGCSQKPPNTVHRSFYYWRSSFQLSNAERNNLQQLSVTELYLKFFDVVWNEAAATPQPVAPIRFKEKPIEGLLITPVVFITAETIERSSPSQMDTLAHNMARLLSGICSEERIKASGEVQVDCDWTAGTKEKYFHLLTALRSEAFFRNKIISATIRLHQLTFRSLNGVPPVDKGLLMCYNMGNLRHPQTKNSIIDVDELKKYTGKLHDYPLPLAVALPLFDWYVWFHKTDYKGLIHAYRLRNVFGKRRQQQANESS